VNPSQSHLVIIPSYNTGAKLAETVADALQHWKPVWVVIDGSTDGSDAALSKINSNDGSLRVLWLEKNSGKGGAVLHGLVAAQAAGFSFALVMDADGQHPAQSIPEFMRASEKNPNAMILGVPQFPDNTPAERLKGRRVGNWWTNLETLWGGINDSLFGFRVYPIADTVRIMQRIRGGRRYDFDTELAVRLFWSGWLPINIPAPVRYFSAAEGGVSHFHYLRDNVLLIRRHLRLVIQMLPRLPRIWMLRKRTRPE